MTVRQVVAALELRVLSRPEGLDREVTGGYASDLLSDVMAHGQAGGLWVTLQTHRNIVAVAALKELAAVILVNGRAPDPDTLEKAAGENVLLLASDLPAFELIGRLYQAGIRGVR
jgi:hypothetical protein